MIVYGNNCINNVFDERERLYYSTVDEKLELELKARWVLFTGGGQITFLMDNIISLRMETVNSGTRVNQNDIDTISKSNMFEYIPVILVCHTTGFGSEKTNTFLQRFGSVKPL